MTTATQVHVHRKAPLDLHADIERVRKLAIALDSQFDIMGFKVGWDAIIGLVPGIGDLVTALIGIYPIMIAQKHGLGRIVQARMAGNLFIDWLIGEVPLIGDFFDAAFKANLKNLAILEEAANRKR